MAQLKKRSLRYIIILCVIIAFFTSIKLFAGKPYQYRALPKSGTHLIAKSLYLLTGRLYGPSHFTDYDKLVRIPTRERTMSLSK